eukprot:14213529-Alexandrium_andersonii.AAC.1
MSDVRGEAVWTTSHMDCMDGHRHSGEDAQMLLVRCRCDHITIAMMCKDNDERCKDMLGGKATHCALMAKMR